MTRLAWITFELSQTVTLRRRPLFTMKEARALVACNFSLPAQSNNLETDKKED